MSKRSIAPLSARLLLFVGMLVVLSSSACGGSGGGGGTPDGGPPPDGGGSGSSDSGPTAGCGDGIVQRGEACDDGNTRDSDGCAADCSQIDPGYRCPDPGQPCRVASVCGNGLLELGEQCDDRNLRDGDGCTATCALVPGWTCTLPGIRCTAARCGDGIVAGFEQCDDGNGNAGDGCSIVCQLEAGSTCPTAGMPCRATTCGDGVTEGTEECDDQNNNLGDGCDPLCRAEPRCSNGVCMAVCGDGVIQSTEACDDGNLQSDDGCSAACAVEPGFTCSPVRASEPATQAVTIVYRDFRGFDLTGGHPDFEHYNGADRGIVGPMLGSDGKPVYASATTTATTTGAANFASWYRDAAGVNLTYPGSLVLGRSAAGTYVFDSSAFFPLDGRGFVAAGTEPTRTNGHNFSFTSELRYWFQYAGGEVLSFRGDDDVWVFINGRRALDLGGVHSAENGSVTLDAATATSLGLTVGGTYGVVVFQAERHTNASSYRLTLKDFNAAISTCDDDCGDGVTSPYEVCDDGTNDGSYGSCTANCLGFGERCGDGVVQAAHEQCDDGINLGGYGVCQPQCQLGPRCGDNIVQPSYEECDSGGVATAECTADCRLVIE
jgi:fibro-slime domain-containing protein